MIALDLHGANDLERAEVLDRAIREAVLAERERCIQAVWGVHDRAPSHSTFCLCSQAVGDIRSGKSFLPRPPQKILSDAA